VRLIEDVLRAGITPALIFFLASGRQAHRANALLDAAQAAGVPCWELSPAVFGTLSETVTSQGVIAVVPIPVPRPPPDPGLILVLDQIHDPGNLGTILRSAEAAGVDLVLLMRGCVDPWGPKVLRAGMGAHFRLAVQTGIGWAEVAQWLAGRPLWLADPRGTIPYDQVDWARPCALVIGGETAGFSPEVITLSQGRVMIPMAGQAESLNAAMAATVLLFEAARQRHGQRAPGLEREV
jgi:TrmH family RNA methyltransferase